MKKKILIGSIFVLILLLLMPSIPAIQQKSIEEGFKQEIQEKLETISLEDLKDIKVLDWIRHPLLYIIILKSIDIRYEQIYRVLDFLIDFMYYAIYYMIYGGHYISYAFALLVLLICSRVFWLAITLSYWSHFWYNLSDKLNWNWDIVPYT